MAKLNLKDLSFVTEAPKSQIIVVPVLLSQETFREAFLPEYNRVVVEEYGNNDTLRKLDEQGRGSNPFIVGLAKKILASHGLRPAKSADDRDEKISDMVRNKHYTDFEDLVVHSPKHTYARNEKLLRNLIEIVEDKVGRVEFPFKVTGIVPVIWEKDSKKGYGLRFVPADDFHYVSDKRLSLYRTRFNTVDEKGIIKPDENGSRIWYSKSNGLSRLCLGRNLSLYSDDDILAGSHGDGRVVCLE